MNAMFAVNQQIRSIAKWLSGRPLSGSSLRAIKGALIALLFLSANTMAAEIPRFDKTISMAAREQPVSDFFAELFGHIGVPVKVDPNIKGTVNGDFQGTAEDIYRDVEKAFQLTMYFDSSKVFIYSSDQLSRKILPMSEKLGRMVLRNAEKMNVGDSLNKAIWSDMGLVVTGTERYRKQIESYSQAIRNRIASPNKTIEAPEPTEIIKVFKLKYAWADDTTVVSGGQELLVRGVATLLRTVVEAGMVGVEGAQNVQRSRLPRTEEGLRGKGLQSVGHAAASGSIESGNESSKTAGASGTNPSLKSASYISNTRIVADPLNNAVIIRDRSDRMQNYQDLINVLDVEPEMVEIEATIIDMDTDRLRSLGIDWRVQHDGSNLLFGSANATNNLLNNNPASITDGLTGFTQNVLNDKTRFLSRIRALEQQKAARIVSKPHVMTLANVEALLDTTSTFFIRVAGREEVDLFNVSVGTTMRVTPHVFNQGGQSQIKLKIDIVDGNQASQEVDGIPVIDESTINTQAIINAGQSLLIGGLVREFKSTGVTKVPVLGSIPGIGSLFRNTSKSTSRVERMFLITPRLNSTVTAGKRYSVPILSGTEAQIIESGPARIEPTLSGLASRDNAFPLRQPLPVGEANVGLTVPNQPLPDPAQYPKPNFEPSDATSGTQFQSAAVVGTPQQVPPQHQTEIEGRSAVQSVIPHGAQTSPPGSSSNSRDNDPDQQAVQPGIEPSWQSVKNISPNKPLISQVNEQTSTSEAAEWQPIASSSVATQTITFENNHDGQVEPARTPANGTKRIPQTSNVGKSNDGWIELPGNDLRQLEARPVTQRTVQQALQRPLPQSPAIANESGWTEIK